MTEQAARELAFPSMTCPMTGKQFDRSDVLELVSASSGFAAKGNVEAKIYRPSIN
jgi:nitric oxide synthase-interacting protein